MTELSKKLLSLIFQPHLCFLDLYFILYLYHPPPFLPFLLSHGQNIHTHIINIKIRIIIISSTKLFGNKTFDSSENSNLQIIDSENHLPTISCVGASRCGKDICSSSSSCCSVVSSPASCTTPGSFSLWTRSLSPVWMEQLANTSSCPGFLISSPTLVTSMNRRNST